jgi:hypothetical protein
MEDPMQKWEYLRVVVNMDERVVDDVTVNDVKVFDQSQSKKTKEVELSDLFEKLGGEGWELVNGWGSQSWEVLYFKRPV